MPKAHTAVVTRSDGTNPEIGWWLLVTDTDGNRPLSVPLTERHQADDALWDHGWAVVDGVWAEDTADVERRVADEWVVLIVDGKIRHSDVKGVFPTEADAQAYAAALTLPDTGTAHVFPVGAPR